MLDSLGPVILTVTRSKAAKGIATVQLDPDCLCLLLVTRSKAAKGIATVNPA
jgi:hypothetical protein